MLLSFNSKTKKKVKSNSCPYPHPKVNNTLIPPFGPGSHLNRTPPCEIFSNRIILCVKIFVGRKTTTKTLTIAISRERNKIQTTDSHTHFHTRDLCDTTTITTVEVLHAAIFVVVVAATILSSLLQYRLNYPNQAQMQSIGRPMYRKLQG